MKYVKNSSLTRGVYFQVLYLVHLKDAFGVTSIAASHCTGELAQKMLKEAFGESYMAFGLGMRI